MGWFDKIFKKNIKDEEGQLSDEAKRWNKFIDEVCMRDKSDLSPCQKAAVLSFWYDTEMYSGGHSGYFDCYPEVKQDDLIWALNEVGGEAYIDNFKQAVLNGESDDYIKADETFYSIQPRLTDILMNYVERHANELLI